MKNQNKISKLKLMQDRMLSSEELLRFRGGLTPPDYCCGLFVNISCNGVGHTEWALHCSGSYYGCLELYNCAEAHCQCSLASCNTDWCSYA